MEECLSMIDMSQVGIIFGEIIAEFLVELSLFIFIFFRNFKRRDHFVIRLVISYICVFAIGFALSFFYYLFGNTVWGRVIVYLLLFASEVGLAFACYQEKPLPIVFNAGLAYAIQNIMYKTWLLFYCCFELARWPDTWNNFTLIYHVLYYLFIAAFILLTLFVVKKKFNYNISDRKFSKKMLFITVMCLVTTIMLCSLEDVFFARFSSIRENRYEDFSYFVLRQTGNLLSILACVLVLYLASRSIAQGQLEKEVEYLEYTIRQSKKQYEISKDTIEMINVKVHDMKYYCNSLASQGEVSQETLKKLEDSVKIYDSKFETGNQLLNTLLWEKSSYCEQNNIAFSCMIDGENFSFMDSGDLYCLFGNLIDNALEAVTKIKDKNKRIINLSVKRKGNIVLIEEDNYFVGDLDFVDGLPKTTKGDKNYHGFGTRSLRIIARKYNGELTTSSSNNIFHLSIIMLDNSTK